MKTLTVGDLKTQFSQVLKEVREGQEYAIAYGKKKEAVAIIISIDKYQSQHKKKLGVLEKSGKVVIKKNFTLSEEEFLQS